MSGISGSGTNYPTPVIGYYFMQKSWKDMEAEELVRELNKAVNEDPYVRDPAAISVTAERKGTDPVITIVGHAPDEKVKDRIEQIVTTNTNDEISVRNELVIK